MDRQVITVDIAPGSNAQQRLMVSQGDIGRPLGVRIIQNGAPLDCSDYTAFLYVLKPDHNYYECTCTVEDDSLICWETAEQETPIAGECLAAIRIMDQDTDIGTATFVEFVEASPADLGYASESLVSSMTEFVDAAQRAAEEATQAVADVDNVSDVAVNATGHIVLTKVLGSTVESDETVLQPGDIENDLLATTAGKVLDARQGKALKDLVDAVMAQIGDLVFVAVAPSTSQPDLTSAIEAVWDQIPAGKAFVGQLNYSGRRAIYGYKYSSSAGNYGCCIIANFNGTADIVFNNNGTFGSYSIVTSGTGRPSFNTLTSGVYYRKFGNIVQVNLNIATSLTTTWSTLGTLPEGYRPDNTYYYRVCGSSGVGDVTVLIATTGAIQARVDSGTGTAINGLLTF